MTKHKLAKVKIDSQGKPVLGECGAVIIKEGPGVACVEIDMQSKYCSPGCTIVEVDIVMNVAQALAYWNKTYPKKKIEKENFLYRHPVDAEYPQGAYLSSRTLIEWAENLKAGKKEN